ncbi:Glyceraldehyde-3-phosphate dehydrogenase [Abeliophyllum distichum]|uniref:Glyceraldehyde-3-phosphate dehydrogenase n=1 Tax=Abeliophyllum distichum TaxID=126358 RepID=A0ABD1RSU5_9LAMI
MEGVYPIRGVDGGTGEVIPIDAAPSLREADDPFRADVVRWAALDGPSIMVEEDFTKLREAYRIPADIKLVLPGPNERTSFLRRGCTAFHLNAFVSGMRLPRHLMFRRILRSYGLAPTQVAPNGWSHMVGGMYLLFRHSFGMDMPLHVFQTVYQLRKLSKKKGRKEEAGWVYDDPEPDLDVPSFYGIANTLHHCELSKDVVHIVRSIYQVAPLTRSYRLILNRHRCLVELGLMASKGDTLQRKVIEDLSREGNRAEVTAPDVVEIEDSDVPEIEASLKRKMKCWASRTGPSQSKKKAVEGVDNYTVCAPQPLQRTLSVNPSSEVVLDSPPWVDGSSFWRLRSWAVSFEEEA